MSKITGIANSPGVINHAQLNVVSPPNFTATHSMPGSPATADITVPGPGQYIVSTFVNTAAGTNWDGEIKVNGASASKSGTRTSPGQDAWTTTITVP